MEKWKNIPGFDGFYQISNHGRVRRTFVQSSKSMRILGQYKNSMGYFKVILCLRNIKKNHLVHRLVAQSFVQNRKNAGNVNHKDLDQTNNHYSNLEWCTQKENINHYWDLKKVNNF